MAYFGKDNAKDNAKDNSPDGYFISIEEDFQEEDKEFVFESLDVS